MKKVLLSLAAVASVAAAVPAMAQPFGHGPDRVIDVAYGRFDNNINQRQRDIAIRIDRGQRDGSLNWREARMLKGQLAQVASLEQRYRIGGLNGWERADLNQRLDRLSAQVRSNRHDGEYGGGYGHGRDHDGYGRR
jgi:hypothetical protein